jgi:alkylation response protein AidB-like acyl-CoA dehydrogenase
VTAAAVSKALAPAEQHYLFTTDHNLLRETIRSWVAKNIQPHIDTWEAAGQYPRELFTELGRIGFLGLQYPEQYGGQGGDFVAAMILCEEISRVGAESVGTSVAVHTGMAVPPILKFGTEEQKQRYLPGLISGELMAALAISEPNSGSDVASMTTRARRDAGGDWILDGQKTFITNGAGADVVLVVARTDPETSGHAAFSLFLVDTRTPGFQRGRRLEKIGRHASDTSELTFDSVRVPADALIGEPGRGFYHLMWELEAERILSSATSVALGYHALQLGLDYVKTREQFGRPLADFQAIRHEFATLAAQLTAARELVYYSAYRFIREHHPIPEISMAKLFAADILNRVADYSLQVHGGYGYMAEYPIGRVWKDARVKRIAAGTDEIQREIIAKHLLGKPTRR